MAKDPVCGMEVDEAEADLKSDFNGKTYYFCCPVCQDRAHSPYALIEVGNPVLVCEYP
ncbi:MAG: YHS domain-containing protein [Nitrososphaeria archaeon]|nr:YHS domain-containing protein [Nitrososphaeria archaeon]